jgi:hypothetical protein
MAELRAFAADFASLSHGLYKNLQETLRARRFIATFARSQSGKFKTETYNKQSSARSSAPYVKAARIL